MNLFLKEDKKRLVSSPGIYRSVFKRDSKKYSISKVES